MSEQEFRIILEELDKYNDLKEKTHSKQSGLSKTEKKKLIEAKAQALGAIQKMNERCIVSVNKFALVTDPPPKYREL